MLAGLWPAAAQGERLSQRGRAISQFSTASGPAGHLAVAWLKRSARGAERLVARVAPPGRRFSPPGVLAGDLVSPVPAVGPAGEVLVAWWARAPRRRWTLMTAFRPAGGSFERPRALMRADGSGERIALAFDRAGRATAVWEAGGDGIFTAAREASGAWSATTTLAAGYAVDPHVAFDASGAATAAWSQPSTPEDPNVRDLVVAVAPPGGAFGPPGVVAGGDRDPGDVGLAVNGAGAAALHWVEVHDRRGDSAFSTHAAYRPAGGVFGAPLRTSPADGSAPGVALASDGRAILAWRERVGDRPCNCFRIGARVLEPAGELRAPVLLLRSQTGDLPQPLPSGLVVWRERGRVGAATARPDGSFTPRAPLVARRSLRSSVDVLQAGSRTVAVFTDPSGLHAVRR